MPSILLLALVCFFFSGAAALVYEVVWLRLLGLVFGHTVHATTTVLTAYMGGLALGSLALGRRADRVRRPLLLYGALEAAIGLYCLCTPLLFAAVGNAYGGILRVVGESSTGVLAAQFCLAAVILIVPTTLMGATLPLLSRALVERDELVGARVGALYGINTLGAVVGVVAAGFWFLPIIGLRATVFVAFAMNVVIAAIAMWAGRGAATQGAARRATDADAKRLEGISARQDWAPLVAIGLSGAASMAYEIAWTRALTLVVGSSTYAFSIMLSTFLGGLALGALVTARSRRLRGTGIVGFGLVECAIALVSLAVLPAFGHLPEFALTVLSASGLSHRGALVAQFVTSAAVMFIPTLLIGTTLPLVVSALSRGADGVGKDVGQVYGANTLGTIAGSAIAGFLLVPLAGIRGAILVAAAVNLAAGAFVLFDRTRSVRVRWAFAVAGVAFVSLTTLMPAWNRQAYASGVAVYADRILQDRAAGRSAELSPGELLYYSEGLSTTVSVAQYGERRSLAVNGKADASNGVDMVTQLLLGHLPALLVPDAERALVIGLGSGVTAGAVAQHPLEEIDVAELEPRMAEAAELFRTENHAVLDDSRVRLLVGDGRHVLSSAERAYDIIISEPSNPWIAGVANLFTREFYELSRDRLANGGVMVQWLQGYTIFTPEMQMVLRTFQHVFPHVTVWRSLSAEYLLVGSMHPVRVDVDAVRRRLEISPGARSDLSRYAIDPENLPYRIVLSDEDARRYAGVGPLNTDDLPGLEFAAPRALYASAAWRENDQRIRSFRTTWRAPVVGGDGRTSDAVRVEAANAYWTWGLVDEVRDALSAAPAGSDQGAALARADLLMRTGRVAEATAELERLTSSSVEAAAPLLSASRTIAATGVGDTVSRIVAAARTDPGRLHEMIAVELVTLGEGTGDVALYRMAASEARIASRHAPRSAATFALLGEASARAGLMEEALDALGRAAEISPIPELYFQMGDIAVTLDRRPDARRFFVTALQLRPEWPPAIERLRALGSTRE